MNGLLCPPIKTSCAPGAFSPNIRLPSEAQCEGKLHILLKFLGFTSRWICWLQGILNQDGVLTKPIKLTFSLQIMQFIL